MRPSQVLTLVRRLARQHDLTVAELPGRGKGSHRMYQLLDDAGTELARYGLTDHPRDLSWSLLRAVEDGLAPWLGQNWTEKKR
ncbi:MAG: hypothetical protein ACT4NY_23405 [Pseudonocardiales bacterium]